MKIISDDNRLDLPYLMNMRNHILVKSLFLFALVFFTFVACEKDNSDNLGIPNSLIGKDSSTDDVVTGDAVNLSYTSATIYGYVNNGFDNLTSMGIVYGVDVDISKLVAMGNKVTTSSFDPGTNNRRFSVELTDLLPNTTYYYYAFAGIKTANEILSFTTLGEQEICPDSQHPHLIDLGLPSGTKWACCNVGASSPKQYGDYYAWGEIFVKDVYSANTYQHWNAYGPPKNIGSNIAGTQYDVASKKWGMEWCMPTSEQCRELFEETTSKWTSRYGVKGRIFIGTNDNAIFFPAAGYYIDNQVASNVETYGYYWSSTNVNSYNANSLYFNNLSVTCQSLGSSIGCSVRPVNSK